MKKQVVILFGPPGAGKGTQAELLYEKMGLYLFETSKILEKEFKKAEDLASGSAARWIKFENQKFDVLKEKKLWKKGILCSPGFVVHLVVKEFKRLSERGDSLVLSGSPRTLYEAEKEIPVLESIYGKENIKIILIDISSEVTEFRNAHRKICQLIRHSILFNKETENLKLCPLDGSKLVKRMDIDDPEVIKVRLKEYKERTLPLINYFKNSGFKVKTVNGEKSVAEVHYEILKAIN